MAESLLERNKRILTGWRGETDVFFERAKGQYFEILKDCREAGVPLEGNWDDLVVVFSVGGQIVRFRGGDT